MPKFLRSALRFLWDLTLTAGPVALIAIAILAAAYWWLDPTPPRTLRLATGPAQSAYAEFGSRYAAALQAHGVKVVQIPTAGSSENLQLLRDGGADFAFVRGGAVDPVADEDAGITSLGSLFLEPVWVFYRSDIVHKAAPRLQAATAGEPPVQLSKLTQLKGLRINVDIPGSGVPHLVERLLALNKIEASRMKLSNLPPAE
ncbi:MAG: C4-dicarboxylate ABC transporter substrate-binding protein, partial [Burkholderiaceae bacterium]|nr:C4-dicarboxylate ABC transporter substrate-binding protein [Burkholderiaceae bacterium]